MKVGGSIIYIDIDEEYREGKGGKRVRPPAKQEENKVPPSKKQRPNGRDAPHQEWKQHRSQTCHRKQSWAMHG